MSAPTSLPRVVGIGGAVMMGLGSILGTGVFVTIGIAAGLAGPSVILAIVLAAIIAAANGLSSAQLAASHPVSGGTYEYGYRYLNPQLGFTAGWMFLCAKSASAATAALGFTGYSLALFDMAILPYHRAIAFAAVVLLTLLVLAGVRRSNRANTVLVLVTIASLLVFITLNLPDAITIGPATSDVYFGNSGSFPGFLEAVALMFVAFTGYGRIATLGEEVGDPRRTIPKAIVITLFVSTLLYLAVAWTGLPRGMGISRPTPDAAPLVTAAGHHGKWAVIVVSIGAITAMLAVLLNLILGLSRVALAMGRRGDLPAIIGRLDAAGRTPPAAVLFVAVIIAGLVLIGDVKTTWSFSAFSVLIYYAITNMAALKLREEDRLYPRWIAVVGLIGCLFLAFWVEPRIWKFGLVLIGVGLLWHLARVRMSK